MSKLETLVDSGSQTLDRNDDLYIVRTPTRYERQVKPLLDLAVGALLLIVTLPVMALIALAIRVGLGKGVIFTQQRVGKDREPFTIYKFRTMRPDRRQRQLDLIDLTDRRGVHKATNDPRHTGLGRMLRKMSLDELPQLVNVVRGEMSLVGPRPEVVDVARERGYLDHPRHDVKPGITGPYQVSELRLRGDLRDGLTLDAHYVGNVTFWGDLRYLAQTAAIMFGGSTGS